MNGDKHHVKYIDFYSFFVLQAMIKICEVSIKDTMSRVSWRLDTKRNCKEKYIINIQSRDIKHFKPQNRLWSTWKRKMN